MRVLLFILLPGFFLWAPIMHVNAESALEERFEELQKNAKLGDAKSQTILGYLYESERQDYAKALEWYRKAVDQGFGHAQYHLGAMYHNGYGVEQDYSEAVQWYLKAAGQGDLKAQHNLGMMYYEGKGIAKDYVLAHMWLSIAASRSAQDDAADITDTRDELAKRMSPADLSKAKEKAERCLESEFSVCG